ncbi:MAG: U32 family peptidase [Lachnospiraceae bacterium]|nr:U32 family peptidase [Lachnospiraceae bacterium]
MQNNTGKKPLLLCPAGSPETLRTAVRYGADAVYLGGEAFGLRANARNFSREEMADGIKYAHEHGVRVHVTANILAHEYDLAEATQYFRELSHLKPDALLIADPGMFMLARQYCPDVPLHVSTQANNTNSGTFRFWYEQGAKCVVCARELSLKEIADICKNVPDDLEIEAFVHGAMCISYSGRCLMSSFMAGRDANRGECTHPCRWKYALMEEKRPGEYFPVFENDRGSYVMNSRDLCMIEHIPELIEAGIDSFKIEGRMKTALYVAALTRAYRRAIDDWFEDPALYEKNMPWYREEVRMCTYRDFTTGFYFAKPSENDFVYANNTYKSDAVYIGTVEETDEAGRAVISQKNKFSEGDGITVMKADGRNIRCRAALLQDEEGNRIPDAPHPKQKILVTLERYDGKTDSPAEAGDILRTETVRTEGNA